MATIVVTGAAGFLGSNLVEVLLASGHRVLGFDNLVMGTLDNLREFSANPQFTFYQRDVTEPTVFDDIKGVDCVVHLAAWKIPRYGGALKTLKINYTATEQALELARREKCKCVVASTSDVYGRNPVLPFSEESSDSVIGTSKSPRWAYAVSKLFDEHLALAYQEAYQIPVVALRFFGSYGPRQHLSWWAGPQSVFINACFDKEPIPIHGDGKQTRSFTFVTDTVAGIYAAITKDSANGEIINIGSREEVTILHLAETVQRLCGISGQGLIKFVPYESFSGKPYQDVMRRIPDTTLCEKLLGVSARVRLEDGLVKTIAWQREARIRRGVPTK